MRKLLIAAAGLALAMGGAASAADMRLKAPAPPAPIYSWTGCYVGGGLGYGLFDLQHDTVGEPPGDPAAPFSGTLDTGGRGWVGVVSAGCDVQLAGNWLIGAFADFDWTNIRGQHAFNCPSTPFCPELPLTNVGEIRQRWAWGVGARLGYIVVPQFMTYFSAGFTGSRFSQVNLLSNPDDNGAFGLFTGAIIPEQTFNGYFIGGGTEYAIGWLPGLFWKTEYRFSDFRTKNISVLCIAPSSVGCDGATGPLGAVDRIHPYVQTIWTELVWRFNWAGAGRPY
ncbi:MAG TPA: hypothetical protein VGF60_18795 [Xanthobacteraceae bacterium]|jgi:outer membrane immunogenic protein